MRQRIQQLLKQGEGLHVEFKKSQHQLSRDVYETVCAFLNREGGDLLLGVADDGAIIGVNEDSVLQQKRDFANNTNNPQKLNPPCQLTLNAVPYQGKTLLHCYVYASSQVHDSAGKVYDRNEDGDYNITDQKEAVIALHLRKRRAFTENTIYPHAHLSDLEPTLIERARTLALNRQPTHPWQSLDNEALLKSAQLWKQDLQSGKSGLTLAALLLFGKDESILSALPHYRTDAILRRADMDRYDDREDIRCNLLDGYDRLMAFGRKHLNSKFYLEGAQRIDVREILLREVVVNLLIHREYTHPFPAKLLIEIDRISTENANNPNVSGVLHPEDFSPHPKNPSIARVFREMGWAEELGSGVRNLHKYGRIYSNADPELREGEVFFFELAIPKVAMLDPKLDTPGKILTLLREDPSLSAAQMAELIGVSKRTIERNLSKLREAHIIDRVGSDKGGHWTVLVTDKVTEKMTEKTANPLNDADPDGGNTSDAVGNVGDNGGNGVGENEDMILDLLREDNTLTAQKMAVITGLTSRTIERHMAQLKAKNLIHRHGSARKGYWVIK